MDSLNSTYPPTRSSTSPSFVLVHGAWHGGWCWQRVTAGLSARGHRVYAPSLTGLGDRSHLLDARIGLDTHVTDIVNLVEWEDLTSVVLCGHSYGGMVIAGAAEKLMPRIRAMVFLDAFVPEANKSLMDLTSAEARARREAIMEKDGSGLMKPNSAEALGILDSKDREWVDRLCTPHPYKTFTDSLPSVDALNQIQRKIYVRARGIVAPMHDHTADRLRSQPNWAVIDSPHGHDLMVDAPDDVIRILLGASDADSEHPGTSIPQA